jgi:hypothetical protein
MRHLWFAATLVVGLVGCKGGLCRHAVECDPCPAAEAPRTTARVETQAAEEVEVRAPRQKVYVDVPACEAKCKPAPPPCPPAFPGMMPGTVPMMNYGQPMMAPVTAQVEQPTRMGFMFDTIRIPMPIIRPIAVPRAPTMTMTMPMASAMMPMMPMMPMAGAGMMGMMPMAGAGMMPAAQQPMGVAQLQMQGQLNAQAAALMLMAANGQLTPQFLTLLSQFAAQGATPQQLAQLLQLAAPAQSAVPPRDALQSLLAGPAPAATPAPPPAAAGRGPASAPPLSAGMTAAVPASTTSLREQVRQAEQRLRDLEELRRREQR